MCLKHDFYEVLLKFLPPGWITWKTDTYSLGQCLQYSLYYVVGGYFLKLLGNHCTKGSPYCRTPCIVNLCPRQFCFLIPKTVVYLLSPYAGFLTYDTLSFIKSVLVINTIDTARVVLKRLKI